MKNRSRMGIPNSCIELYDAYQKLFDSHSSDFKLRERQIWELRHKHGRTFQEIGKFFDLSGARVQQIEAGIFNKLRKIELKILKKQEYDRNAQNRRIFSMIETRESILKIYNEKPLLDIYQFVSTT